MIFPNRLRSLRHALSCGLLAGAALAASAQTTLSTSVTPDPALVGGTVNVAVRFDNATDLYGYQFGLDFNPAVLQFTGATPGPLFGSTGLFEVAAYDNTLGFVALVSDTLTGPTSLSGGGVLAQLTFSVAAAGTSPLTFSNVFLIDAKFTQISTTSIDGSVSAVPEPSTALLLALGLAALGLGRRTAVRG